MSPRKALSAASLLLVAASLPAVSDSIAFPLDAGVVNVRQAPASKAFAALRFTQDYLGGAKDAHGQPLDGTECNCIVAHRGQLFATITYLPEDRNWANLNPTVLVKHRADGPWELDHALGNQYIRAASMRSVAFTTDGQGRALPEPTPVLVVGDWKGARPQEVGVWTRNDATGTWTRTVISQKVAQAAGGGSPDVRVLFEHVDRVTKVHYVFAGVSTGTVYRGVYDPNAPGTIAWSPSAEIDEVRGRPLSAAEANGVLYAAFALDFSSSNVGSGGLYRRIDGPEPKWEPVALRSWDDPHEPERPLVDEMRGLTAVPDPKGGERQVLLCGLKEPSCAIARIDPADGQVTLELNVREYFEQLWGNPPGKHLIIAYNEMTPATDPDTKEPVHLIGLWVAHPDGEEAEMGKSAWYLVRYADGSYGHGRVFDPGNPPGGRYGLRATRTICASPFPEDRGRVWYFGGFDEMSGAAPGNHAWIYQAALP